MLREVAGVEVSAISHISALEGGLRGQARNLSAEIFSLKEEVVLTSEWVSGIEQGLTQDRQNVTDAVSGLQARLAGIVARLAGLEGRVARQTERFGQLEAAEARGEANARWLAKQHQGVLAVEEALAAQLDGQRRDARKSAAEAGAQISGLRGRLAAQERAVARLAEALVGQQRRERQQRQRAEEARGERAAGPQRSLRLQRPEGGGEGLEANVRERRSADAALAATVKRQGEAIVELQGQLKRQRTVAAALEADVDREERRYLDQAELAKHEQSSRVEAEQSVQRNLTALAESVVSHGKSIASLKEELAEEKSASRAREEMAEGLVAHFETQQQRSARAESSSKERDLALQAQLSRQQQDAEFRAQTLGEFVSKQAKEDASLEASTRARVDHLEMEVSRQREAQAAALRTNAPPLDTGGLAPPTGRAFQADLGRWAPAGAAPAGAFQTDVGRPSGAAGPPAWLATGTRLAGVSALGGIAGQRMDGH